MFQSFHHALAELRGTKEKQCKKLSKRLHEIKQSIQTIVDLVVKGKPSRALMERLAELETERDATEVAMAKAEIAQPITFKPDAADDYRAKVKDLKAALAAADAENRAIAYTAIRELIDKVVIRPNGPCKRTEIDIHGRIQSLFAENEADTQSKGALVAGVGFEPTTFRL
jgi:site-specific DNA recombinase